MAGFDLGSLSVRIVTQGRQAAEADLAATGKALTGAGTAADGLAKNLDKAGASASKSAKQTKEQSDAADTLTKRILDNKQAYNDVGIASIAAGAALAAPLVVATKKFADFDAQMAQVQTLSHATAAEMNNLREQALSAGIGVGYSATQVADAETELVKAGISTRDILGGSLKGALDLAAAGQIDVADATSIAASAMTQFKLQGKDVPHIADLLAAGADKALGSVGDLGDALKYVGPNAHAAGVSIEQTVGVLSLLAENGILGSQAGTELRGVLASLTSPSQLAAETMQKYGVSVYDAQGKFIGFNGVAEQLRTKLGSLDQATRNQALGQIFGNQQITAAVLLMQNGAKGVDKWTKAVNDQGFATQQATGKLNSLEGDVTKLSAAFDSDLIRSGSGVNDVLRNMVQGLTGLVDLVSNMPAPLVTTGLAVAAVGGAILITGGTALTAVPKIAAFRAGLDTLGISGRALGLAMGGATIAITGAVAVVGILAQQQATARAQVQAYADSFAEGSHKITKSTREIAESALAAKPLVAGLFDFGGPSVYDAARKLGFSYQEITDAALGNVKALEAYRAKLAEIKKLQDEADNGSAAAQKALDSRFGGDQALANLDLVTNGVKGQNDSLNEAIRIAKQKEEADKGSSSAADKDASSIAGVGAAADDASSKVSDLADEIRGFGEAQLDTNQASRDFQAAIDDLTDSVKNNGTSLDITTDAGRQNSAALDKIAKSAIDLAAATYTQTGSQDQATAAIQSGRDALIAALAQFGITGQAAEDYANNLGLIPANVNTILSNNAGDAVKPVQTYKQWLDSLPVAKQTRLEAIINTKNLPGTSQGYGFAEGGILRYADGGISPVAPEQHVAQIARAGSYRVWAEDETGGEGYIPLAMSKRGRSEAILATIATIFGGQYIPPGARRHADGYAPPMSTAPTAPTPVQVLVTSKIGDVRLSDLIEIAVDAWGTKQILDLDGGMTT